MKTDGTARVCGDYKLTVNKVSKLDAYPIPKLDDLYTKLAGGQTFTELDLTHAYEQMLFDDDSKEYLTINTHKGLYRYNRLPYGVSSVEAKVQAIKDAPEPTNVTELKSFLGMINFYGKFLPNLSSTLEPLH